MWFVAHKNIKLNFLIYFTVTKIAGILIPSIKSLVQRFGDQVAEFLSQNILLDTVKIKLVGGGVWISILFEEWTILFKGQVCSLYFHPTKRHSATTETGIFFKTFNRIVAPPCKWAISCQDHTLGRDRTYYDVL